MFDNATKHQVFHMIEEALQLIEVEQEELSSARDQPPSSRYDPIQDSDSLPQNSLRMTVPCAAQTEELTH